MDAQYEYKATDSIFRPYLSARMEGQRRWKSAGIQSAPRVLRLPFSILFPYHAGKAVEMFLRQLTSCMSLKHTHHTFRFKVCVGGCHATDIGPP